MNIENEQQSVFRIDDERIDFEEDTTHYFYVQSNDHLVIKLNKELFKNWNILHNTSDKIYINLQYNIILLSYTIILSIIETKSLPVIFPLTFEEFFYFCEMFGAPVEEKELLSNTILDYYKPGWKNFMEDHLYSRMNDDESQFYQYQLLWARICDHLSTFRDHSMRKLIISNISCLIGGCIFGYFFSMFTIICR
jgi:hypothetical protein